MTDDWMRPIVKPLPGPVPTEDAVLTPAERAQIAVTKFVGVIPHQCGPDCAFPDLEHVGVKSTGGRPQERESLASTEHLSSRRGDHART